METLLRLELDTDDEDIFDDDDDKDDDEDGFDDESCDAWSPGELIKDANGPSLLLLMLAAEGSRLRNRETFDFPWGLL